MAAKAVRAEGHRLHLRSLARSESAPSYRRHDYLSRAWQEGLWRDEAKEAMEVHALRQSPTSVVDTAPEVPPAPEAPSEICVKWRERIVEWKYQVVDRFDLDREIVSVSTFYLDKYLSMHYVDEELFQLVAMASIYLAIKIHSPKKVTVHSIASTGNGLITARHIEAMELSIMKCLDWHLFPPTAAAYIENLFPLLPNEDQTPKKAADALEFARFLAELSVCAYPFVSAKPSSVALAAMLYSFEYYGHPKGARAALQTLARDASLDLSEPEIEACGRLLRRVYRLAMPNDALATPTG